MVHGAGGGGWEWRFWEPIFQKRGWKTIAPDLMPSVSGLESTKLTDYEAQALGLGTKTGKSPARLCRRESGGDCSRSQSRESFGPDALVLVNSVPPKGVSKKTPPIDYPAVVKWANGPLQETRTAMPDCDEATIQFAWKRWRDESGAVMNELGRGVELPNPTCPVLVVIGGKRHRCLSRHKPGAGESAPGRRLPIRGNEPRWPVARKARAGDR